jgi:hypothetical protein
MISLQVDVQFITDAYLVPIAIRKTGCLHTTSTEGTDLSSMAISISRRLTAAGNFGDSEQSLEYDRRQLHNARRRAATDSDGFHCQELSAQRSKAANRSYGFSVVDETRFHPVNGTSPFGRGGTR